MGDGAMETITIGSLEASRVGLGCNNFGGRLDEDRSAEVVRAALDAGITFFDTADAYGGTRSEEILGRALVASGRRDEVVVATKFASPLGGEGQGGASPRWIAVAVEGSLRRLGVDVIDLYQQHMPDDTVPIEETLGALDELVTAGKVREIGNSNFRASQIEAAADVAEKGELTRFVTAQNNFSLIERSAQRKVIPACERHGLVFLPYFPLASGLLTGKYRRGEAAPEGTRLALWGARADRLTTDANFDLVDALSSWAAGRGHTILSLAFAWLAAQPAMGPIIAGATSPAQVAANVDAVTWTLTDDELDEVDAILASTVAAPEA
jgi:aryl-alcohol dehydrogenase-like predicted oxidoreductase